MSKQNPRRKNVGWVMVVLLAGSCSERSTVVGDGPLDAGRDKVVDLPRKDGAARDAVGETACVPEGEYLNDPMRDRCCHNFIPVVDKAAVWKGQCEERQPRRYLCTQCGDDLCRAGETICNCPVDCSCYGAGDQFEDLSADPKQRDQRCCTGLTAVEVKSPTSAGTCAPYVGCTCYVCVSCGDNVCGPGENVCTCLVDCSP